VRGLESGSIELPHHSQQVATARLKPPQVPHVIIVAEPPRNGRSWLHCLQM